MTLGKSSIHRCCCSVHLFDHLYFNGYFFRALYLRDNKFKDVQMIELLDSVPSTIEKLDLSGKYNAAINLNNISKLVVSFWKDDSNGRNFAIILTHTLCPNGYSGFRFNVLRSLSLGKLASIKIASEDFQNFGVELEDLKLTHSFIETIKSHAFKYVRGVRRIDLSENYIGQIDNDAFAEVTELFFFTEKKYEQTVIHF